MRVPARGPRLPCRPGLPSAARHATCADAPRTRSKAVGNRRIATRGSSLDPSAPGARHPVRSNNARSPRLHKSRRCAPRPPAHTWSAIPLHGRASPHASPPMLTRAHSSGRSARERSLLLCRGRGREGSRGWPIDFADTLRVSAQGRRHHPTRQQRGPERPRHGGARRDARRLRRQQPLPRRAGDTLVRQIATMHGVAPEQVLLGCGSTELCT
jgi:hypothetical protein